MRTARGLPFVCRKYMQLILEGILARVQRDQKVTINHYLWMNNHLHMLIQAKDSEKCKRFYGEIQKQVTEAVKRLLGLAHLNLWRSNGTSVVRVDDVETIIDRIAYFYANPARANLVDSIDDYPGLSSFHAFRSTKLSLGAEIRKSCPWIRAPMIDRLPSRAVADKQDEFISRKMLIRATQKHDLLLHPNAWMASFGITHSSDIAKINGRIHQAIKQKEEEARQKRRSHGWKVMGARRLTREALRLDYTPSKDSPRIFVYSVIKEIRIRMIAEYRDFCRRCRDCFERWKIGDYAVEWPPGSYKPPQPNNTNWLSV